MAGEAAEVLDLRNIPQGTRNKAKASDFAGKNRSFPILKPADVRAALQSIGRAGSDNYSSDKLKANIIRIAKRKGFPIPDADKASTKQAAKVYSGVFDALVVDLSAGTDKKDSWVQLFKTGKFWDSRYGTFSITRQDLAQIRDNFELGLKSSGESAPVNLPMDYNHGTSKPETPEKGMAAGWIRAVELRKDGAELWAQVEWTPRAAELIAAKEYQFVSPTFAYDYTHSNGKDLGTTLLAAAITNRPVLEGMSPLTLGKYAVKLSDGDGDDDDGQPDGGADDEIEWMFSFDEIRRRVQAALSATFGYPPEYGDAGPSAGCYLVDIFDGRAIYREYDGELYEVVYTIDAAGNIHFQGTPAEVVVDYHRLDTGDQETEMSKLILAKDADGKEVKLSEETLRELAKQIGGTPVDNEKLVQLSTKVDELTTKATKQEETILDLTTRNAALELAKKRSDVSARVDKLVSEGRLVPADRDETIELGIGEPKAFDALEKQLSKREPVVKFGERKGSGDEGGTERAMDRAVALARTEMEKNNQLDMSKALKIVFKNDPALYAAYTRESAVKV